jgi:hypothetical protein
MQKSKKNKTLIDFLQGNGYGCLPVEIGGRCYQGEKPWHAKHAKVVKLASNP